MGEILHIHYKKQKLLMEDYIAEQAKGEVLPK